MEVGMDKAWLEAQLAEFPLYQYDFIRTDELVFSERVRYICRTECPMYDTNWACPPAVGTLEECRERVMRFEEGLMIATITEVSDIANIQETLATRAPHEEITRQVQALVRQQAGQTLTLSTEACAHCEQCAYPNAPCRFPERMFPCVESHCILVTDLAEKHGIDFIAEGNVVTWFSLILYR
jgi:predicted metal-binding protein